MDDFEKNTEELFKQTKVSWKRSKEDVWADLETKIDENKPEKGRLIELNWVKMSVAAAILVLLAIPSIMRFYTIRINCPAGNHLSYVLPDGSGVQLNANSSLAYHPLWWKISRSVEFSGEGFFEVEKGSSFEVNSAMGKTEVLGTSFNIFARSNSYNVICVTGKVKVVAKVTNNQVLLNPNEKATIDKNGQVNIEASMVEQSVSWVNNKFIFTSIPLTDVLDEVSRQYALKLHHSFTNEYFYTGGFTKQYSIEEVLNLICKPFNLAYEKKSGNEYIIREE